VRPLRAIAGVLVLAAVLAVGIALGMALHDNPRPSGPIVVERTVTLPAEAPPAGATVPAGP
jgi:hypothetical protein